MDLLDFENHPIKLDKRDLKDFNSKKLDRAVQSRLRVLKSLFNTANEIESAQIFISKFHDLESLPEAIFRPEKVDGRDLMFELGFAKGNISNLYDEAFQLTLLTLANHHPFLVLNEPRVIPFLVPRLFSEAHIGRLSPALPDPKRFKELSTFIAAKIEEQKAALLSGASSKLKISTRSESAVEAWIEQLNMVCGWVGVDPKDVEDFASRLGFEFKYQPPSDIGITSM